MPDVVPFLTYEDGIAALEWLAEVFGFTETARFTSTDGRLSHGEMSIGDGVVMLASPSPDYEGPKRHRDNCEIAASWSALPWIIDGVLVYVDDIDEHYARAKAAGAVILSEPEDGPPARRYRVEERGAQRSQVPEAPVRTLSSFTAHRPTASNDPAFMPAGVRYLR